MALDATDRSSEPTDTTTAGEAPDEAVLWAQVARLGTADPRPIHPA